MKIVHMLSAAGLLVAGLGVATPAIAQSQKEIRKDVRKVNQQQRDLEDAKRNGTYRDVKKQRKSVAKAKQELREDIKHREKLGYAPPVTGWTYSPLTPGARLQANFYAPQYVITDLGTYKLQPSANEQRWIRYGNDIVLVNTVDGTVSQVLRDRY